MKESVVYWDYFSSKHSEYLLRIHGTIDLIKYQEILDTTRLTLPKM